MGGCFNRRVAPSSSLCNSDVFLSDGQNAIAFQSVPDTAEVDVLYDQNGQTLQMTFYAEFSTPYVQTDINNLAGLADAAIGVSFLPLQTLDATYLRTEVRGLTSIIDLAAVDAGAAGPGAGISGSLPNQVTFAVQRNAGLTGRSSRGRVFWIGLQSGDLSPDENVVITINAVAIVAAIENMRLELNKSGWTSVIVSRFTGGVKRPTGITNDWINTLAVDTRVDTLRGRLP